MAFMHDVVTLVNYAAGKAEGHYNEQRLTHLQTACVPSQESWSALRTVTHGEVVKTCSRHAEQDMLEQDMLSQDMLKTLVCRSTTASNGNV